MAIVKSLINSEELVVEGEEIEESSDIHINYDLAVYPSDLTLSVLHDMWKKKDIEIPEYQRHFVWSIRQASLLIDSFLLGLRILVNPARVLFYSGRCSYRFRSVPDCLCGIG